MSKLPQLSPESDLVIETDQLELRATRASDAQALFPVLADSTLYEFTGEAPPESMGALRVLYAFREGRLSPDQKEMWLNWTVREKSSKESIGYMQATVTTTHSDIAWLVGSPWQRRGYASEAARAVVGLLRDLGVKRIRAKVHPRHGASKQVAARAGLARTGEVSDGEDVWILDVV